MTAHPAKWQYPGAITRAWRRGTALIRTVAPVFSGKVPRAGYLGLAPRYNTHNLGDALMLPIFRRELPNAQLHHSLMYRPIELKAWRWSCRRAFSACILGGGTLIFWQPFLDYLQIAQDAGVPCYVLGTGVLDPDFWERHRPELVASREHWIEALKACRFVGVRGETSKRILSNAGVTGVEVVGDPCLLLAKKHTARPKSCLPPVLGVNWGTAGGSLWGGNEQEPMEELARAAATLAKQGWHLRVYGVWPGDRAAMARFTSLLPEGNWSAAEYFLSAEAFMTDVAQCRAFVGLKLHATALALCAGVPAIMLDYRPKCSEFMQSVELEDLLLRTDQLEGAILAARLNELSETWGHLHERFTVKAVSLASKLKAAIGLARNAVLSGRPTRT